MVLFLDSIRAALLWSQLQTISHWSPAHQFSETSCFSSSPYILPLSKLCPDWLPLAKQSVKSGRDLRWPYQDYGCTAKSQEKHFWKECSEKPECLVTGMTDCFFQNRKSNLSFITELFSFSSSCLPMIPPTSYHTDRRSAWASFHL